MEQNEFCSMGVELNQRLSLLRLSVSFCSGSSIQVALVATKDLKWSTGVKVTNVPTRTNQFSLYLQLKKCVFKNLRTIVLATIVKTEQRASTASTASLASVLQASLEISARWVKSLP